MPKVRAKVLAVKNEDGKLLAKIQLDGRLPAVNDIVSVKWGSVRTLPQNALYWTYLGWCINEGGLKEHGHFFADELHSNLKKHLLKDGILKEDEVTTTDLTKSEFSDYFKAVDKFIQEFFEISTEPFWQDHEKFYANK